MPVACARPTSRAPRFPSASAGPLYGVPDGRNLPWPPRKTFGSRGVHYPRKAPGLASHAAPQPRYGHGISGRQTLLSDFNGVMHSIFHSVNNLML